MSYLSLNKSTFGHGLSRFYFSRSTPPPLYTGRVHYMIMQERECLECFEKCPTPWKGVLKGHFMFCPEKILSRAPVRRPIHVAEQD